MESSNFVDFDKR